MRLTLIRHVEYHSSSRISICLCHDIPESQLHPLTKRLSLLQLTECCVNVLVTAFKETILAECPFMIKSNETESKYLGKLNFQN